MFLIKRFRFVEWGCGLNKVLLFNEKLDAEPAHFTPVDLEGEGGLKERRIQELVFRHPEFIPIEEIDPGAGQVASLCQELTLQADSGPVRVDILGVTRRGRLVLVECKLWRNPQARREVIGQILEYAALIRKLSYGDLSVLVQKRSGLSGPNVLWSLAKGPLGLTDEAAFVDAVSHSLEQGAFDLVVLGDGIRRDLDAVRAYLEAAAGLRSRLALVELSAWRDGDGRTLFVPKVALRSQIVEHRVAFAGASPSTSPGALVEEADAPPPSQEQQAARADNKAFWQAFIDGVTFSHPDQASPVHGGNNTVRLSLPGAALVAYRTSRNRTPNGEVGLFLRFRGEDGKAKFDALDAQLPQIEAEIGAPLTASWVAAREAWDIALKADDAVGADPGAQLAWLQTYADKLVNAFRPRLAQLDQTR